ncbi:hypothetical protein CP972_19945 [Streptomyces prasinus]|uniref:Secreted protein n=1 Tax=Streptomyces prasinus TaxID=67345 RepID=A0ABX6B024_9ACTN|nr:hypothetical protein CP972_19945 [Streptomyces prasinus]
MVHRSLPVVHWLVLPLMQWSTDPDHSFVQVQTHGQMHVHAGCSRSYSPAALPAGPRVEGDAYEGSSVPSSPSPVPRAPVSPESGLFSSPSPHRRSCVVRKRERLPHLPDPPRPSPRGDGAA